MTIISSLEPIWRPEGGHMRLVLFLGIFLGALNSFADKGTGIVNSIVKIDFTKDLYPHSYLDCRSESNSKTSISFDIKTVNNTKLMDAVYFEPNTRLIRKNMRITEQQSDSLVAEGQLDDLRQASSYLIFLDTYSDGKIKGSVLFSQVSSFAENAFPDIKIRVLDLVCAVKKYP